MSVFDLPEAIKTLVLARNEVRDHYRRILQAQDHKGGLSFTLDGNLIGDIGEAIAVELFGIRLVEAKSTEGIDGYASDGKTTVQVKATGAGRGPAFWNTQIRADHLLFFDLDFENASGTVVYNGPEHYAASLLPSSFKNQRSLSRKQIIEAKQRVLPDERLPLLRSSTPSAP